MTILDDARPDAGRGRRGIDRRRRARRRRRRAAARRRAPPSRSPPTCWRRSALALFSLAVAAGFARVFAGWDFFDNLRGARHRRPRRRAGRPPAPTPGWVTIPIVALVAVLDDRLMFYGSTYSWGLPSGDTWTLFSAELDLVREQFHVAVAPVLDGGGWPVLAAIGMAFAVCLSDAFAFGALARAEALVPGGVLFVFIAALGDDRLRVELSVRCSSVPASSPPCVLRAHHAPGGIRAKGQAPDVSSGRRSATATVVALLAGWVGSAAPGGDAEAAVRHTWQRRRSASSLSPLVDIRSRLTNQTARRADRRDLERRVVLALDHLAGVRRSTWTPADRDVGVRRPSTLASRSTDASDHAERRIVGLTGDA